MSRFVPTSDGRAAEATLTSMFKFPEGKSWQTVWRVNISNSLSMSSLTGSEVHLQCDVIQCYGRCVEIDDCNQVIQAGFIKGNSGPRKFGPNEEGSSIAGTTVFVLDPAEARCEW